MKSEPILNDLSMINRFDVLIVNVKILVSMMIFEDFQKLLEIIRDYQELFMPKTTISDEFILFDKKE